MSSPGDPATTESSCPIVLMHGFGAFLHLLAPISLDPLIASLRDHGVVVVAPKVEPYSRIEVRANAWKEHVHALLESTGSRKLDLLAYSSGGLDARYLITCLGGENLVRSLTTISTPHRGSSIATYILGRPDLIRRGLTGFADFMGRRLHHSPPDAQRSLEQLTPESVAADFNPSVPDHPEVQYFSWAGRAGIGTSTPINPLLRLPNRVLFEAEGENDGIVSVSSATWTGFQGTIEADHGRQIGVKAWNGDFEPLPFVLSIVTRLRTLPPPSVGD